MTRQVSCTRPTSGSAAWVLMACQGCHAAGGAATAPAAGATAAVLDATEGALARRVSCDSALRRPRQQSARIGKRAAAVVYAREV